jgi:hypothetical protein
MALGSPVSLDYHKKGPFKFNGTIDKVNVKYIPQPAKLGVSVGSQFKSVLNWLTVIGALVVVLGKWLRLKHKERAATS